jgi:hypothetical protein
MNPTLRKRWRPGGSRGVREGPVGIDLVSASRIGPGPVHAVTTKRGFSAGVSYYQYASGALFYGFISPYRFGTARLYRKMLKLPQPEPTMVRAPQVPLL